MQATNTHIHADTHTHTHIAYSMDERVERLVEGIEANPDVLSKMNMDNAVMCMDVYDRNRQAPDDEIALIVAAFPRYTLCSQTTNLCDKTIYKAWIELDNYLNKYATRVEVSKIMKNRSCWMFYYTHMNTDQSGEVRSVWGPSREEKKGIVALVGGQNEAHAQEGDEELDYMDSHAMRLMMFMDHMDT